MRVWKLNPKFLCNQHLLGEHLEVHMFINAVKTKKRILGYINNGLVEVHNLVKRHEELAQEMKRRGFNHKSPIRKVKLYKAGRVDVNRSVKDLRKRCEDCKTRLKNF